EPMWMKEKHVRFQVRQGQRTIQLKAWNFSERSAELVPGGRVDIVFDLEADSYSLSRGYGGWCGTLRDLRPPGQGLGSGVGSVPRRAFGSPMIVGLPARPPHNWRFLADFQSASCPTYCCCAMPEPTTPVSANESTSDCVDTLALGPPGFTTTKLIFRILASEPTSVPVPVQSRLTVYVPVNCRFARGEARPTGS